MLEGLLTLVICYVIISWVFDRILGFINRKPRASQATPENLVAKSITTESAGLCRKCGEDALWNVWHEFEHTTVHLSVCSYCEPHHVKSDQPVARTPAESYTKNVLRPAGLCLKCGEDALWSSDQTVGSETATHFICTYCEPHLTGVDPEKRSADGLTVNL